ncbi:MAG: molecular chaperone DnaJ [Sphingobium sp.]|nr:molecular chaperone DnaJ [Sphingobium sp.]
MALLGLLLVLLAAWLIFTGRLQRMTALDGVMLGIAIVGALVARGNPLLGGVPLAIAALYTARRFIRAKRAGKGLRPAKALKGKRDGLSAAPDYSFATRLQEARALLGVDASADEAAIRAAHRRLIAKIHPDAGGTQALAEKINDARTILLRHIHETTRSHNR